MNEKQYEAFRLECARRDGYGTCPICGFSKLLLDSYCTNCQKTSGSTPIYEDHNSLQGIIDGLNNDELFKYVDTLIHITDGTRYDLVKATVEQKQAALCAVFGLGDK